MRIVHTSDWHIGVSLYGHKRYEEFEAFFSWLLETLQSQAVDCLIVAGDIFDTMTPSNRAIKLYFRFLSKVFTSKCRHVVVTAGNHDSPTLLDAQEPVLQALDIRTIGEARDEAWQEVLVLKDEQGKPELIVCAVPYLRDRDVRLIDEDEGMTDKDAKLLKGIEAHYQAVSAIAEQKRQEIKQEWGYEVPIIATAHLFTADSHTEESESERKLYIGSLAQCNSQSFPKSIDYLALGHLHIPQAVSGSVPMRYAGSPLSISFSEAGRPKSVCLLETSGRQVKTELLPVPCFRELHVLKGKSAEIIAALEQLKAADSQAWLDIICTEHDATLKTTLDQLLKDTGLLILRHRVEVSGRPQGNEFLEGTTLKDISPQDVFERRLLQEPEEKRQALRETYREAVISFGQQDTKAE